MHVTLQIMITAPDEVLEAANEVYATVERDADLPFTPYPGLYIHLQSDVMEDHPEIKRIRKLSDLVDTVMDVVSVNRVYYHMDIQAFVARCDGYFFPTLEKFHAAIELLQIMYGFTVPFSYSRKVPHNDQTI